MTVLFPVLFFNLGTGEVILIVFLLLLFFGADNIPGMARALGKGLREMKNATAEIQSEIEKSSADVLKGTNIQDEVGGLNNAADNMKNHLSEGLGNLEKHYSGKEEEQTEKDSGPDEADDKTPPGAIKRD
ncbi:MAG TPA: twin-arginine translocase TatA/TatE family subunit [Bacteroidia bacterium]|nr:twin-arginine translocase TatA/TatE family subunit [Bacteroidia bacterium]